MLTSSDFEHSKKINAFVDNWHFEFLKLLATCCYPFLDIPNKHHFWNIWTPLCFLEIKLHIGAIKIIQRKVKVQVLYMHIAHKQQRKVTFIWNFYSILPFNQCHVDGFFFAEAKQQMNLFEFLHKDTSLILPENIEQCRVFIFYKFLSHNIHCGMSHEPWAMSHEVWFLFLR